MTLMPFADCGNLALISAPNLRILRGWSLSLYYACLVRAGCLTSTLFGSPTLPFTQEPVGIDLLESNECRLSHNRVDHLAPIDMPMESEVDP